MRVGVVTPRQLPTVGGGFTLHTAVLSALGNVTTDHEFLLLDLTGTDSGEWSSGRLPVIDVPAMVTPCAPAASAASAAESAARRLALDVVWYLDPLAEVLTVPVFATVLDLAHRQHPFFPEVSSEGWDWNSRERHYRHVLPRAARIFTGTQTGKEEVIRSYGVNPSNIVVNPFPNPMFGQIRDSARDDEVLQRYALTPGFLFYPAQFWPHKNHANLLLALKQLEAKHALAPDLVCTGEDKGNLAYIHRLAKELGLQKRLHILGFVPREDMAALYRCAAALVFPSFFGPDNLPPLEAFHFGCPVLASRIDGAEEQLGRNAVGFFNPTRPEEIAAAIARVLRNRRYRSALVKNGLKLVSDRTPETYVQAVLRTLDEFEPWRRTWPNETMQPPCAVSRFPADLADVALLHSGIFTDGWLAERSTLLLSAPREASLLTVRGVVPLLGDPHISLVLEITDNGRVLGQSTLGPGPFNVTVEAPAQPGLRRIDLAFSETQKLPDPDGRRVGARVEFVGFDDQGHVPVPAVDRSVE